MFRSIYYLVHTLGLASRMLRVAITAFPQRQFPVLFRSGSFPRNAVVPPAEERQQRTGTANSFHLAMAKIIC